ncbi:MAG: hypothetical protein H0Z24_10195 [Thermosipho sp. (in: Bacteria)]|nr:hypothetical protein [Thermosipho sp. (in: thermotogales)]
MGVLASGISDVVSGIGSLLSSVTDLLDYINPFSDNFILKVAFVPSAGYFDQYWSDIRTAFEQKIPLVTQLYDFFSSVLGVSYSESVPEFKISLPAKYGGVDVNIIDFSYFADYRDLILNFIRFTSWFFFLKRLFKRLPQIVY